MDKLLCIVGPTGTGKTARAIMESLQSPSIIVSADSRQVFRGMNIVTGKDHPKDTQVYGIDIVDPDQPVSVAVWYDAVIPHIHTAWETGKQVILVGGTGLYLKAITQGIATMQVPINQSLRDELNEYTVSRLQDSLQHLNSDKLRSMNESDHHNPRRLIRAIEIEQFNLQDLNTSSLTTLEIITEFIGLKYTNLESQESAIRDRVISRLNLGAIDETKNLLKKYDKNLQSMSALGYKSLTKYLAGEFSKDQMLNDWVLKELQYAKRQLTWFRKQSVIWYDVDNK